MGALRRIGVRAAMSVVSLAVGVANSPAQSSKTVDVEALAAKLVTEVARIHEGDMVRITGGVRNVDLLEALAIQVRRLGAFPLITLNSDRLDRRMYEDVPDRFDTQSPDFELGLAGMANVEINVEYSEDEIGALAGIPARRIQATDSAASAVSIVRNARGVQQVNLGNDIYPTTTLARRYGLPLRELDEIFWAGVNVDYAQLKQIGEKVKSILAGGSQLRITHPNGTDLRVNIGGSLVYVSDGTISYEDLELRGASRLTWLPAGEVYFAPSSGSAEGKVVVDKQHFQGSVIEGLELTFEGGRLTSMTAISGIEPLRERYDAADMGKDEFGFVDVGINPAVQIPQGSDFVAWMAEGMVTVGVGGNVWAGGANNVTFALNSHLAGATLTVDGTKVIDGGVLLQ